MYNEFNFKVNLFSLETGFRVKNSVRKKILTLFKCVIRAEKKQIALSFEAVFFIPTNLFFA